MIEESLIELLKSVGFPIFVVLWFMFRTEKILREVIKSNTRLGEAIEKMGMNCPYLKLERRKKR